MIQNKLAVVFLVAIGVSSANAQSQSCPIAQRPVASAQAAVALSREAIIVYGLTSTPLRCLDVAPSPGYTGAGYEIDVRELHGPGCGEALPVFEPLVMSIHVTPSGMLTTTAGTQDARNTYRRPTCPASRAQVKPSEK